LLERVAQKWPAKSWPKKLKPTNFYWNAGQMMLLADGTTSTKYRPRLLTIYHANESELSTSLGQLVEGERAHGKPAED